MSKALQGILPALVTPFDPEGKVNLDALSQIVRYHLMAGVDGFYVCGGTGEGMLLTADERRLILETVLGLVQGKALVIAHIGAYHTSETLSLARHASQVGADAIAALPPAYFFKPDELGLIRYYSAIAEASEVPLLIYNFPQRTGITMTRSLFERLLQVSNITGMKDSSGDTYSMGLYTSLEHRPAIFSGEDTVLLGGLLAGACGGIGATYNIIPLLYVALWKAFKANDMQSAAEAQRRINKLVHALLVVDLFGGLKQTMQWMGFECGEPRTPNRALTKEEVYVLRQSLEEAGFFAERTAG